MPGIKISEEIRRQLPENQREDIVEILREKAGGICFLCSASFNEASDNIVADHDIPVSDDGPTNIDNLNLAHSTPCNSFKKNHPSVYVRPYLKLEKFLQGQNFNCRYGDVVSHFGATIGASIVKIEGDRAKFQFPDGSIEENIPVFEDQGDETYRYCFVKVPIQAIHNDDDVQPRNIKPKHVWQIYLDINSNPLHEPPSCRIDVSSNSTNTSNLKMFDGQHKTIAVWMKGVRHVTSKVYFNLSTDNSVRLVNSIQSVIKKLPLSPFELATKLGDEFSSKLRDYESQVPMELRSEDGFFKWMPQGDRARGRTAFRNALIANIADDTNLNIMKLVRRQGIPVPPSNYEVTEGNLKGKLIQPMLRQIPLSEGLNRSERMRELEKKNIIDSLNYIYDTFLTPPENADSESDRDNERRKRFRHQVCLAKVATLIRNLYQINLVTEEGHAFMKTDPTDEQRASINRAIDRLFNHPVWFTPYDSGTAMSIVGTAVSQNQNGEEAFNNVGLTVGYCMGVEELDGDWNGNG